MKLREAKTVCPDILTSFAKCESNCWIEDESKEYLFKVLTPEQVDDCEVVAIYGLYNGTGTVEIYLKPPTVSYYEFERKMKAIAEDDCADPDKSYKLANDLLCTTLKLLGYTDGIEVYEDMKKWYE